MNLASRQKILVANASKTHRQRRLQLVSRWCAAANHMWTITKSTNGSSHKRKLSSRMGFHKRSVLGFSFFIIYSCWYVHVHIVGVLVWLGIEFKSGYTPNRPDSIRAHADQLKPTTLSRIDLIQLELALIN
jgi:hypothetical protein